MTTDPPSGIPRSAFFLWLDRLDPPITKADLHTMIDHAGLPERTRRDAHILVDEAIEFDRASPLLQAFAAALGLPDQAAIDAAFRQAYALLSAP